MEAPTHTNCRLLIGTSGYSYAEWIEAGFYPPGTKSGQMLPLYAKRFPITELNYTWYRMPWAKVVERQRQQAPREFLFAAKLTRLITMSRAQAPRNAERMAEILVNRGLLDNEK